MTIAREVMNLSPSTTTGDVSTTESVWNVRHNLKAGFTRVFVAATDETALSKVEQSSSVNFAKRHLPQDPFKAQRHEERSRPSRAASEIFRTHNS